MKQHSNSGGSLGFMGLDNSDKPGGYSKAFQTNASGRSAKENYGRGPTKVGAGSTGVSGKLPPAHATGREQKRNPSGTKEVPACKYDYNMGIGPRKGNSQ